MINSQKHAQCSLLWHSSLCYCGSNTVSRASSFTGDSLKFRNNASLMAPDSSYFTTCISIVRLNFLKRCEYRKCGTVWCHYNIVSKWRNPKKTYGSMRCTFRQWKLTSFHQDKTPLYVSIHNNKKASPVFISFTEICTDPCCNWFLGWGVNNSASVTSNLLQATIPNTVIPLAWTQPISSMLFVSNFTTLPKAAIYNLKSY